MRSTLTCGDSKAVQAGAKRDGTSDIVPEIGGSVEANRCSVQRDGMVLALRLHGDGAGICWRYPWPAGTGAYPCQPMAGRSAGVRRAVTIWEVLLGDYRQVWVVLTVVALGP